MPATAPIPGLTWYSFLHAAPLRPLHTWVRTAEARFRPARFRPFAPRLEAARERLRREGGVAGAGGATILREAGRGRVPTIVLGGFVPDSTEQVFLLRRVFLAAGDLYCFNYPRDSFSLDLLCAQLDDLVAELGAAGQPPVLFGVSFGAGLILEWLRRARGAGRAPVLAGLVLVSPVACVADVLAPEAAKPATLLGRAVKPYLAAETAITEASVERSRTIFTRMFEAGAQNKLALRRLMTRPELEQLRGAVMGTIRGITADGARQRMRAMTAMRSPTDYFVPAALPLTTAPTLVLFAEREEAVMDPQAPSLFAFRHACQAYFPAGHVREVAARPGDAPVQHASLIFHVFEFLPPLQAFYTRVRHLPLPLAA